MISQRDICCRQRNVYRQRFLIIFCALLCRYYGLADDRFLTVFRANGISVDAVTMDTHSLHVNVSLSSKGVQFRRVRAHSRGESRVRVESKRFLFDRFLTVLRANSISVDAVTMDTHSLHVNVSLSSKGV